MEGTKKRKRSIDSSNDVSRQEPPQKKCKPSDDSFFYNSCTDKEKRLFTDDKDQKQFVETLRAIEESGLMINMEIPRCITEIIAFDSTTSSHRFHCINDDCKRLIFFVPWDYDDDEEDDGRFYRHICGDAYFCEECIPLTKQCNVCDGWRLKKTVPCSVCSVGMNPCGICKYIYQCTECHNTICIECRTGCYDCYESLCSNCFDPEKTGKFKVAECNDCGNYIPWTHTNCYKARRWHRGRAEIGNRHFTVCSDSSCSKLICIADDCDAHHEVVGECEFCQNDDEWPRYYCDEHADCDSFHCPRRIREIVAGTASDERRKGSNLRKDEDIQ